jgi:hypothetical protein
MASKLLNPKSWTDTIKGSAVEGDDFEKALAKYEKLVKAEGKPEDRLKAIDSIGKLAEELKEEVAAVPKAKKYLADVAGALKTEKLEITKASAGSTIAVTFSNESRFDDLLLSVEDWNVAKGKKERWPLDQERLNKQSSLDLTLAADGDGEGWIRWFAQDPESPNSGKKEEELKDIKDGRTIKVSR